MAANSRFEISSSSPDGSNFNSGYSNGQRSHFSSASNLERSSSFRENLENRLLTAGSNLHRGGTSAHGELLPLSQVLLLDLLSMGDQKHARQVELRRVINAAMGSVAEDPSSGAVQAKPLASLGGEELRRVKANVSDNSLKARERVKFLNEAICKLDKYRLPLLSRKRSRTEVSPSNTLLTVDRSAVGGNLLKTGSQNHAASNSVDPGSQRSDERNKAAVPNKRVRTSMVDVRSEGRPNNVSRPYGVTDREKDLFRSANAGLGQSEDKDRTLPTGSEGWDKTKLKGRRSGIKSDVSAGTVANRTLDGEREHKRGIQHRPNIDSRARPSEGHGFRWDLFVELYLTYVLRSEVVISFSFSLPDMFECLLVVCFVYLLIVHIPDISKTSLFIGSVVIVIFEDDIVCMLVHKKEMGTSLSELYCCDIWSGPVHGIISMHKMENSAQPSSLNLRPTGRNELDVSTLANEKRDRFVGLEKDRTVLKSNIKYSSRPITLLFFIPFYFLFQQSTFMNIGKEPNVRDENHAASPTTITKGKASRAPRTSSGATANSSPHFPRTSPTFDGWERAPGANRVQLPGGSNNRKRPVPTRSSSPPVAQWVGQRPPKMARVARRTNLVPPVSNRDDITSLAEGSPNLDTGTKPNSTESNGPGFPRRASSNCAPPQSKLKTENVSLSAGLSESEESGAGDNKSKEKNRKQGDTEEKIAPVNQKVGALVLSSKKSKTIIKEESGDGVRRQGRSGRGLTPLRTNVPLTSVKIENTVTAKQLRSTRPGPEKVEKSTSNQENIVRSEASYTTKASRESDDDHEELLAAVNAAVNASCVACSGSFWKQMEPFFAFLTQDDLDYLKQQCTSPTCIDCWMQIRELEDATAIHPSSNDQNGQADLICSTLPTSPNPTILSKQRGLANGSMENDSPRILSSLNDVHDIERPSGKYMSGKWFDKMLPLSQRLLAALIIEDDTEETCRIQCDGRQDEYVHYTSGDSPCGTGSQIDSETKEADKVESEIESEAELVIWKHQRADSSPYDGHNASNGHRNYTLGNRLCSDEPKQEDDVSIRPAFGVFSANFGQLDERHTRGGQKNQGELQSSCQTIGLISGINTDDIPYQQMCLDDRILLELHSIGLFPEIVPDLAQREEEEIKEDIYKLQDELQQQVFKNKGQVYKLEKAVFKRKEYEERERERLAMNKLVERAYNRHMGCRGTNASGSKSAANKVAKQAALAFVKRTLAKCRKFDETGRSCFAEASLKERIFCIPSTETDTKLLDDVMEGEAANAFVGTTPVLPDMKPSAITEHAARIAVQHIQKTENGDKESCDTLQAAALSSEQTGVKDELWSTRSKKRELLLEEVVGGSILRGAPVLGNALLGGAKGKRSERDREGKGHNKEILTRTGAAKSGRPGLGNAKGERKTKPKPRQKTAQLSAAANGLLGKPAEAPKPILSTVSNLSEKAGDKLVKVKDESITSHTPGTEQDLSHDTEGTIDLSHLQLPGMDDLVVTDDLGGQGQDLGSWLNFEDDGLQDAAGDFMGLDVPMDDLSDLAMMV
eukprot:Gb_07255 [translate_table: standard]